MPKLNQINKCLPLFGVKKLGGGETETFLAAKAAAAIQFTFKFSDWKLPITFRILQLKWK